MLGILDCRVVVFLCSRLLVRGGSVKACDGKLDSSDAMDGTIDEWVPDDGGVAGCASNVVCGV